MKEGMVVEFFKDYYKILNISPNAKEDEIKTAYKKLAKKFHPDLHSDNPLINLANDKLKEINEAYEVLSDKAKREKYDKARKEMYGNYGEEKKQEQADTTTQTQQKNYKKQNNDYEHTYKDENAQQYYNYSSNEYERNNTHKYSYSSNYEKYKHNKTTNAQQYCHLHQDRIGVSKCIICGVSLCSECTGTFDKPLCPICVLKNNNQYMNFLKVSLIVSLISLILGGVIGVLLGIKYDILEYNGIFEEMLLGIGVSIYLTSIWLYLRYISPSVKKYMFKIFKIVFNFFDINDDITAIVVLVLDIFISISLGFILGLILGVNKLIKDYRTYVDFKPEHNKIKQFVKQQFDS